jgi:hypothetical protein
LACGPLNIDERDASALPDEMLDERRAYPRGPAADQDRSIRKRRVNGCSHCRDSAIDGMLPQLVDRCPDFGML